MPLQQVKLLNLPKILDERGNLSYFQNNDQIPFAMKRAYWLYDVPGGEIRGGHAFKEQQEVIIALSGSFDVVVHDGTEEKVYHLNRSYFGLFIPNMIWRHLGNFSTNALALIATDRTYRQDEYIHDFEAYKQRINK